MRAGAVAAHAQSLGKEGPAVDVLLTTIGVPRVDEKAIPRDRLLSALQSGLARRCIAIGAEAGYGKTTLTAQFARGLGWPVVWYTVTDDGRDTTTFFASLLAALDAVRPGVTGTASAVLEGSTTGSAAWRALANALVNDLTRAAPDPMLLVLDDVHVLADTEAAEIPGYLAAHLPAPVRLALLGRPQPITSDLARLAGQGEVLSLDGQVLAFTLEEVARLLVGDAHTSISAEEIAVVHRQTEGWPLALGLIRQALREDGSPTILQVLAGLRGRREIYDFFGTQVLDRLPADLRQFLLRISILDPIDPAIAVVITSIADARAALRDLDRRGAFLTRLDASTDLYRLHPLFRETLRDRLARDEGMGEVRRLQRETGRALVETGRSFEAMPFLVESGDPAEVTRQLAAYGERWLQEGRAKTVEGWIAALPPEVVEASPDALILLGWLAAFRGDLHESVRWQSAAARLATGDAAATAHYGLASALEFLHRYDEARKVCEGALAHHEISVRSRARLLRRMASVNVWSGAPLEAMRLHHEAMALFEEAADLSGQAQVLQELVFLGHHLAPERDWAASLLPRAVALHRSAPHLGIRTDAALAAGELLGAQGDSRALDYLDEAGSGAKTLDDTRRRLLYFTAAAFTLLSLGRHTEAGKVLREGMTFAEANRADAFVQNFRAGLGLLACRLGRTAEGLELLRGVIAYSREHRFHFLLPLNQMRLGLAAVDAGNVDEARATLREAGQTYQAWGAERRAAECSLYLCALDPDSDIAGALAPARTHELDNRFEEQWTLLAPLLTRAVVEDVEAAYAGTVLTGHGNVAALAPSLTHPDPTVRLRAIHILERMDGEAPRTPLHRLAKDRDERVRAAAKSAVEAISRRSPVPLVIRLFGSFEIRSGQTPLSPSAWRRRRARLLFAYLLLARQPVARDTLLEALWPGRDPGVAGASLNVAWSEVKRALEPGLPERLPSIYLVIEAGRYGLRGDAISTDAQDLEAAIARAAQASNLDERARHLQEAVSLYRGDLLADDANEPWTVVERERLRLAALTAFAGLAEARVRQGRPDDAVETLRALLRMEPWREDAYRHLMSVLTGMGRRAEALHLYRQCEALLRRELGVPPSAETAAVFEAIAAGRPL